MKRFKFKRDDWRILFAAILSGLTFGLILVINKTGVIAEIVFVGLIGLMVAGWYQVLDCLPLWKSKETVIDEILWMDEETALCMAKQYSRAGMTVSATLDDKGNLTQLMIKKPSSHEAEEPKGTL